jgi:hypothetical protein
MPVPMLVAVSALSALSEMAGPMQSGFDHYFETRAVGGDSDLAKPRRRPVKVPQWPLHRFDEAP